MLRVIERIKITENYRKGHCPRKKLISISRVEYLFFCSKQNIYSYIQLGDTTRLTQMSVSFDVLM